eukprot:jgi/Chrzof1/2182/Cz11g05080.t1
MKWVTLLQQGLLPGPRSSHALTSVGGLIYLFGGEVQPRIPVPNDVHSYDISEGVWTKLLTTGEAPSPRIACTAAAVGTHLYIYGGRTGVDMGEGADDHLWVLDTTTSHWSKVEAVSGSLPSPRSYHAMMAVGTNLYVFGGCGEQGRLNDLHTFDTLSKAWKQLPNNDCLLPRGGATLATSADGSRIFVLGGFSGRELNDCHSFNTLKDSWECPLCCSTDSGLPARSVSGAAIHTCSSCDHGGHIIMFGGEVDPSDKGHAGAGHFSSETFCLDVDKRKWHKLDDSGSDAPTARGWFASTNVGGNLVVHGGINEANERLADMYMLQLHS